ncbi:Uncharacterized protein FWK35_00037178, partial [Aphis craccivora]
MPCMSNPTYRKLHEEVGEKMPGIGWNATEEAAKEEAKIALENGDVSKDGIPMISVVVDGAWSKRSHRSNYNVLSGVACIVGYKTKKVLFSYFCSKNKDNEVNLVPELQKYGVWNDLIVPVNLVAYHSNSLIFHVNNNSVETYNSVVAKYVGGK